MKKFLALSLVLLSILSCVPALADAELVGNMYVSGFPIAKEAESFTIAVAKDPSSMNAFGEKLAVQEMDAKTNLNIEWVDIPVASWTEQVNIMLASGNLPDAFCGGNVDIMQNIELFLPLEEYIEKYAPAIMEMLTEDPRIKAAITAPDGSIYCLPTNMDNPSHSVDGLLWINKPWLDEMGLAMPTTTDEYVEILRAFKARGENVIPLQAHMDGSAATSGRSLAYLLGSFGATDNKEHVYVKDGETVIFGPTEPGYFEGLKWLHELYSEGLIAADVFTADTAQITAKAQQEEIVFGSIMYWIPDAMDLRLYDFEPVAPLIGPDGTQLYIATRQPIGTMSGFSITTACKNPAALVRYYDATMSDFLTIMEWTRGPEGAGFWKRVPEAGEFAWTQTMEYLPKDMSQEFFKRTVCPSIYGPNYLWSKWTKLEIPDGRNAKKRAGNAMALEFAAESMPYGLDDPNRASAISMLFVDIDSYVQKFFATSVVDGITQAQWDEHLANCKKLRVPEYVALWQEYYNDKK